MKTLTLGLALAGLLLPGSLIVTMIVQPGPGLAVLLQPFLSNRLIALLGVDLVVSSLVFWVWVFHEARRLRLPHPWVFVLANLVVGLCFALPLFLYFRQRRLERAPEH
jgi:hypothetical protein